MKNRKKYIDKASSFDWILQEGRFEERISDCPYFGGQYNQLVARRVRECNVYCEIYSYKTDIEKIKAMNPKGIILTGGPNSCYEPDSPTYSEELFKLGIPVLGLCYGAQLMSHVLGGKVERADVREYGKTEVIIDKKDSKVFEGVSETTTCWMSHFDYISKIAPGFEITAHTADCPPKSRTITNSFFKSSLL